MELWYFALVSSLVEPIAVVLIRRGDVTVVNKSEFPVRPRDGGQTRTIKTAILCIKIYDNGRLSVCTSLAQSRRGIVCEGPLFPRRGRLAP
ncbi:unnamed protein product, partial [Iphiclides podalirius]